MSRSTTGYEEDLPALASRAYELALELCGACANYHIYWPARRAAGIVGGADADRVAVVAQVAAIAGRNKRGSSRKFELLIAGAADSGILSACVEGLFRAGGRALIDSIRFTIVDLCATPLQLCSDYARMHGLDLDTVRADLASYLPDRPLDLVVAHSVLAFMPVSERAGLLDRMAGWLGKDGEILLSANMARRSRAERDRRFEDEIEPRIRAAIAEGALALREDEAAFLARCRNRHDGIRYDRSGFETISHFRCFVEQAGLQAGHVERVNPGAGANGGSRPRLVAVLTRPSGG
jgi:hypothetical protein